MLLLARSVHVQSHAEPNSSRACLSFAEAWNRAVEAAGKPVLVLPAKWIYPYDPQIMPPPMSTVAQQALMWGEAKRKPGGKGIAPNFWAQLNKYMDRMKETSGSDVRDHEPTGRKQCTFAEGRGGVEEDKWLLAASKHA